MSVLRSKLTAAAVKWPESVIAGFKRSKQSQDSQIKQSARIYPIECKRNQTGSVYFMLLGSCKLLNQDVKSYSRQNKII